MSFIVPKKPQILYAPMLSSFGGGSSRGFNPGGGGVVGLSFQFLTTTQTGQATTTLSGLGSGTVGYAIMGGGGSGSGSHYPGGGAGQILYGSYSHPGGDIVVVVGGRSGKLLNNGTQSFNGWSPSNDNVGGRFGFNTTITHSGSTVVAKAWGGGAGGGAAMPYDASLDGGVNTANTGAGRDSFFSNYYTLTAGGYYSSSGSNESNVFGTLGARGSSGGGGAANGGSSGGNGGQGGNNGVNGSTYNGGSGMGTSAFNSAVSSIQASLQAYSGSGSATVGQGGGGNKGSGSHQGGGGGGGIEFYSLSGVSNPNASAGTNSGTTPGSGGAGFGSGGGASSYNGVRGSTGEGAQGFAILWEI